MFNIFRRYSAAAVRRRVKKPKERPKKKVKQPKSYLNMPIYEFPTSKVSNRRIYAWGLAEHGALGTGEKTLSYDKENIHHSAAPHRISFGEYYKVYDAATGYGFTAFAVKNRSESIVYGVGINTDSQIGYQPSDEKEMKYVAAIFDPRPINLNLLTKTASVLSMAAGRAHLLILTNQGLFTLGNNAYGQCGRPIIEDEDYHKSRVVFRIPDIEGNKIAAVTAGQDHSIFLTEQGKVYSCGWGADGQTGLAHYNNEYKPSLVKGDIEGEKIVKVACTSDCVLALSSEGDVFGWGNAEYHQLPILDDIQQINLPRELKMCRGLGKIKDIACGGSFCMALNTEGVVFVWGFGILGFGPEGKRIFKPKAVPMTLFGANAYEPDVRVDKIFCGVNQLAALTNAESLYMWGRNRYGCLGLGHTKDQYFPLKVAIGAKVEKICCGIDHTIAICKPFV